MQTTPHPDTTLALTHFSSTFEKKGSGIIYITKYMFAKGKKNTMHWNAAYWVFRQSNVLAAPLTCRQLHVQRKHQHQRSFQLPLTTKLLAPFTTRSKCLLKRRKTQCAEMQLIEYSTQSNDLAAPLKCRQLHVQREHQHQRSFQLPLKTKVLAPFTTRSTCSQ